MKYINPFTAIFTWNNYDNKVYNLQHKIKQITGQCIVIASHSEPDRKRFDWYYIGEDAYYTKQWNKAIDIFRYHQQYNTLVQIQADASCDNWEKFYDQLERSYEKFKWGIYTPYVDYSPHYQKAEETEIDEDYYKIIDRTDCTTWAINEFIIKNGTDKFDESKYKYGWGIDKYYSQISKQSNLPVIIDYNVTINHPKSSNYDHTIPFQEADELEKEVAEKEIKISLCTTCGNRLHDLKYSLPFNLEFIRIYEKPVEWIIIDYGSSNADEVREYVESIQCPPNLEIVFKRINEKWNMGKAKYASHEIATGDVLLSLDSDNFLGIGYLEKLYEIFKQNPYSIVCFEWEHKFVEMREKYGVDFGYMGKVAVSKGVYRSTAGYALDIIGYGGDDTDLVSRAKEMYGINYVCLNGIDGEWSKTIPTVDEKILKSNSKFNTINYHFICGKHESRITKDYWHKYKNDHIFDYNEDSIYDHFNIPNYISELDITKIHPHAAREDLERKYTVQVPYDHKPYENSDIILVTSLTTSSTHFLSQKRAIKTWKNTGLKIYSVNTSKEISILKNAYPEVDYWIENNILNQNFAVKSQNIQSLIDVAIKLNKTILLINSDIETYIKAGDLDHAPMIGIKHNYKNHLNQSKIEEFGVDVYLLDIETLNKLQKSHLAIGRPFWDYLMLYHMLEVTNNIKVNSDPIFFHKEHDTYWSRDELVKCVISTNGLYNLEPNFDWNRLRLDLGYHNI